MKHPRLSSYIHAMHPLYSRLPWRGLQAHMTAAQAPENQFVQQRALHCSQYKLCHTLDVEYYFAEEVHRISRGLQQDQFLRVMCLEF